MAAERFRKGQTDVRLGLRFQLAQSAGQVKSRASDFISTGDADKRREVEVAIDDTVGTVVEATGRIKDGAILKSLNAIADQARRLFPKLIAFSETLESVKKTEQLVDEKAARASVAVARLRTQQGTELTTIETKIAEAKAAELTPALPVSPVGTLRSNLIAAANPQTVSALKTAATELAAKSTNDVEKNALVAVAAAADGLSAALDGLAQAKDDIALAAAPVPAAAQVYFGAVAGMAPMIIGARETALKRLRNAR